MFLKDFVNEWLLLFPLCSSKKYLFNLVLFIPNTLLSDLNRKPATRRYDQKAFVKLKMS